MTDMGVNHVELSNGETLIDLRNDTVNEDVLFRGYTATDAQGNHVEGKASPNGGGEAVKEVEIITCDFDIATMSASNMSHTHQQILDAVNSGKYCVYKASTIFGPVFGTFAHHELSKNKLWFQLMFYADVGNGMTLYYFSTTVNADNTVNVEPKVVSLLG